MPKFTLTANTDGDITATQESQTILEVGIESVLLPLGITAGEREVVSKKTAAYTTLGYLAVGYLVGEAHGNARGRNGMKSFVPLFRK